MRSRWLAILLLAVGAAPLAAAADVALAPLEWAAVVPDPDPGASRLQVRCSLTGGASCLPGDVAGPLVVPIDRSGPLRVESDFFVLDMTIVIQAAGNTWSVGVRDATLTLKVPLDAPGVGEPEISNMEIDVRIGTRGELEIPEADAPTREVVFGSDDAERPLFSVLRFTGVASERIDRAHTKVVTFLPGDTIVMDGSASVHLFFSGGLNNSSLLVSDCHDITTSIPALPILPDCVVSLEAWVPETVPAGDAGSGL